VSWNPQTVPCPKESIRYPGIGPAYIALVPMLVLIAKDHGYALAFHGSMCRDMDCIAVPWTDKASDAQTLIDAIKSEFDLVDGRVGMQPEAKSHGRLAWSLYFNDQQADGHGPYLDISVIPRVSYEDAHKIPLWDQQWEASFAKHDKTTQE
jgi:hypothetical protein